MHQEVLEPERVKERHDRGLTVLEIADEFSRSMIRVIDLGGMIWESEKLYESIDEALAEADQLSSKIDLD